MELDECNLCVTFYEFENEIKLRHLIFQVYKQQISYHTQRVYSLYTCICTICKNVISTLHNCIMFFARDSLFIHLVIHKSGNSLVIWYEDNEYSPSYIVYFGMTTMASVALNAITNFLLLWHSIIVYNSLNNMQEHSSREIWAKADSVWCITIVISLRYNIVNSILAYWSLQKNSMASLNQIIYTQSKVRFWWKFTMIGFAACAKFVELDESIMSKTFFI